jgi:predicted alpha/beta hydrolase
MAKESISIIAKDGYKLQGAYFPCENKEKIDAPTIAIQPAFGIKSGFYSPLAKFLSQENHVFIFDYRGIGESGDPKLVRDGMHA